MTAITRELAKVQGQILQAAYSVYVTYKRIEKSPNNSVLDEVFKTLEAELIRLLNNQCEYRNDWGDTVQLSKAIILLSDGYIPD